MLYIVYTTGQCNLYCKYCGGSFRKDKMPWEIKYKLDDLKNLIERDGESCICFYGGEPLLNLSFIKAVLKEVPAKKFILQTNGLLIKDASIELLNKFDTILLSIDGVKEVTDMYRGNGVYDQVLENAIWLKKRGFKGDLVARMTLTEDGDIYRDAKHLFSLKIFDHVHWQLNVVWSERWRDFKGWMKSNYLPNLGKLLNFWLENIENGRVYGIVPFQGILKRSVYGGTVPPCGSGTDSVTIATDGRVLACPIAVEEKWALLAEDLRNFRGVKRTFIGEPCTSCNFLKECGGRCLYAYMEKLWGEEGFHEICKITMWLVQGVRKVRPKLLKMVENDIIELNDLIYPAYNNSVEIIP
jgi:putative peptide-modifying radical SAM enzyme